MTVWQKNKFINDIFNIKTSSIDDTLEDDFLYNHLLLSSNIFYKELSDILAYYNSHCHTNILADFINMKRVALLDIEQMLRQIDSLVHENVVAFENNTEIDSVLIKRLKYVLDIDTVENNLKITKPLFLYQIHILLQYYYYLVKLEKTIDDCKNKLKDVSFNQALKSYTDFKVLISSIYIQTFINKLDSDSLIKITTYFDKLVSDIDVSFEEINYIMFISCERLIGLDVNVSFDKIFTDAFVKKYVNRFLKEKKLKKIKYSIDLYKSSAIYNFITSCQPVSEDIKIILESESWLKRR